MNSIVYHTASLDKEMRSGLKHQQPMCVWLTGLSGAGKSTLANELELQLYEAGHHTYLLDGDNVRLGLNKDLSFSAVDRKENIRRVAEVSRLMVDAGLIVITALISPYRVDRTFARSLFKPGEFLEVFVNTPLDECIRRDPKGLYGRALSGQIKDFTGVDSTYEPPEIPEVQVDTLDHSVKILASQILRAMLVINARR